MSFGHMNSKTRQTLGKSAIVNRYIAEDRLVAPSVHSFICAISAIS